MVLTDDRVAEEFEHAADGVPEDRAAQVSDVHLLGDVGAGEVDDGVPGLGGRLDTEAPGVVGVDVEQLLRDAVGLQSQVDEARPRDLGRFAHVGDVEPLDLVGAAEVQVDGAGMDRREGALGLNQAQVTAYAVSAYTGGAPVDPVLLPSADTADASRRTVFLASVQGDRQQIIDEVMASQQDLEERERELAAARAVRIAKWLGDGCMIVAVEQLAAIEFVMDLERKASAVCAPLTLRAGIATGHALLFEGDDYIGSAVNMAARLCDLATNFDVLIPTMHLDKLPEGVVAAEPGLKTMADLPAPSFAKA